MAKVVLLQDVPNIGKKGMILDVKEGYAANFLFPKRLARFSTALDSQKAVNMQKQTEVDAKNKAKLIAKFVSYASTQLVKKPIKVEVKTAVGGRVFGSIEEKQVIEGLFSDMPQLKALNPQDFQIKIPQRIEYAGKYIFEMIVNLDGSEHKDLTVIPLYVDVVSINDSRKK
jgi:large subunit ribosomal protein L9